MPPWRERAGACFDLARALAETGDTANALQALECAVAGRRMSATMVERDALLARCAPRFQAIVAGLR